MSLTSTTATTGGGVRRLTQRMTQGPTGRQMLVNIAILAVLCVVLSFANEYFLEWSNFRNVVRQISVVGIVACAVTLVMVAGGLDLSVGGVAAISGVVAALLAQGGLPILPAMLIGIAVGAAFGLLNGLLIVVLGLNSVIATLGTLYICRGAANLLTDGLPVYGVPAEWSTLGTGFILGVPIPALILLAVVVVLTIVERRTLLGTYAVAVGTNREAARLAGVPIDRVRLVLYVMSGTAAGLGGIILSSQLSSGQPTAGTGLEFEVIVAAVLGGTSLAGGVGTVIGTLTGVLIVGVVANGLNLLGVPSFWQTIVAGLILIAAVGVDVLSRRRRGRRRANAQEAAPPVVDESASAAAGRPPSSG
jgi:ribose transport system permease protein